MATATSAAETPITAVLAAGPEAAGPPPRPSGPKRMGRAGPRTAGPRPADGGVLTALIVVTPEPVLTRRCPRPRRAGPATADCSLARRRAPSSRKATGRRP